MQADPLRRPAAGAWSRGAPGKPAMLASSHPGSRCWHCQGRPGGCGSDHPSCPPQWQCVGSLAGLPWGHPCPPHWQLVGSLVDLSCKHPHLRASSPASLGPGWESRTACWECLPARAVAPPHPPSRGPGRTVGSCSQVPGRAAQLASPWARPRLWQLPQVSMMMAQAASVQAPAQPEAGCRPP